MRPPGVLSNRPKIALVALNITSVTPTVNVEGGGGGGGGGAGCSTVAGGAAGSVAVAAAAGAAGAGFTGATGVGITTTEYLLYSNNRFKKSTLSGDTFFSTMAHFTPLSSSNK